MSHKAIRALYSNVVTISGDIPNAVAFDAEGNVVNYDLSAVQAWNDPDQYKYNRMLEYPAIGDQLDALWKGGEAAAAMLAQVQAVKAKYPKGTE